MAVMFMTRPRSNMMNWLKSDSLALQAVPEWSQPSFAVRSFHSELAVTLALNQRDKTRVADPDPDSIGSVDPDPESGSDPGGQK